ncbi:hypothetical protein AB0919_44855, partial [Streptomyces sp. NPDC046994]|uniref:hypothetical protein n=1 Tax=Streptomyces sp. NPDC046994 TaxID=3155735 RepID=UPI003454F0EE
GTRLPADLPERLDGTGRRSPVTVTAPGQSTPVTRPPNIRLRDAEAVTSALLRLLLVTGRAPYR